MVSFESTKKTMKLELHRNGENNLDTDLYVGDKYFSGGNAVIIQSVFITSTCSV